MEKAMKAIVKRFGGKVETWGVADREMVVIKDLEERYWEDELAYHRDALKVASTMYQIQKAKRYIRQQVAR